MINKTDDYLHFSITATGRCNASCSYCHFYAKRTRQNMMYDINEYIFRYYIDLIKFIKEDIGQKKITYRLSGGEALVMGDRVFEMSRYAYDRIGQKLNILTNGIALNDNIIEKAKKNNVGAFIVSLENPFEVAEGAANPQNIVNKIIDFNSDELQVLPGIVIVSNKMFGELEHICDYFYENLGCIPPISEKTYDFYESPTQKELEALKENVANIVEKYSEKTNLELFPYIIPEIINDGGNEYLVELDIEGNSIKETYNASYDYLMKKIKKSYPTVQCNKQCDWSEFCITRKWIWDYSTNDINAETKREDYCLLKQSLCEGYLEGMLRIENKRKE